MLELEAAVREIEVYGFTLVERVLTPQEIEPIKQALIRCEREVGEEHTFGGPARHVSNLPTLDPLFFPVIDHPRVLPILEQVLGKSLILGSLNARIVRPGDGEQKIHGDIPGEMLNMAAPVMMNTVWMLDDFTTENGATRIVPGTHKSGFAAPPEGMDVKYIHQATAPAGSVLIFNGQCWHGGGRNRSDRNRHALFGHYRKHMLLFQNDPHDGFPPEWFALLTPRQKELLRMQRGLGAAHAADCHF
jgi:ectoine hydroxylase-related dioxygenase (phytanoyl-CoA dioxygenase family)